MSLFIPLLLTTFIYAKETPQHWKHLADNDINTVLNKVYNEGVAKNVILFVGDGLDLTTSTAARIHKFKDGETQTLSFDKFTNIGLLKTYSANKLVPDSSSTATALFCGVKVNHRTVGVDATVPYDNCEASMKPAARLQSIIDWAQDAGKATGFVTTTRVTHATPSALYAHVPNRNWECEAKIPNGQRKCKDIARQLIEDEPGKDINVIFGGGRQCLQSHVDTAKYDPTDQWACYSTDGRDLIHEWEKDKKNRGVTHAYVQNRRELREMETNKDYVLGIFANSHLYMRNDNGTLNVREERRNGSEDPPSLTEMTEKAIRILEDKPKGYVLMVEGGLIDYAHHRGRARASLHETTEFSDAIERAINITDPDDTLIIVTSDHSHSLVFAGYPDRDQGVLGIAQLSKWDKIPYTTLLYGTGGPNNYQYDIKNGSVHRKDPSKENTTSFLYSQQTGIVMDESTHGGSDVVVYANGPWAHLFNSVHEQTYVAYVISYAAKIGPYKERPVVVRSIHSDSITNRPYTTLTFLLIAIVLTI